MNYLGWAAIPAIGAIVASSWILLPHASEAQTDAEFMHCRLDFAKQFNQEKASDALVGTWGRDYELLSPVSFVFKHGEETYHLMVASSTQCRGLREWDWTSTAKEAAVDADISTWSSSSSH